MLWKETGKEDARSGEQESQAAGRMVWPSLGANLEAKVTPGGILHHASMLGHAQSPARGCLQRGWPQCECEGG